MDNNKDISYIVFEGEMARAERHIKRLWITLIVTILGVGYNVPESSYSSEDTQEQESNEETR